MTFAYVLVMLTFAINEPSGGADRNIWPEVKMHNFTTFEACETVRKDLIVMAGTNSTKLSVVCRKL